MQSERKSFTYTFIEKLLIFC